MKLNKNLSIILALAFAFCAQMLQAQDYVLSTQNTSLVISAEKGKSAKIQHYGSKIEQTDVESLYNSMNNYNSDSYPTFGLHLYGNKAMIVEHSDGNMSLDLAVEEVKQYADKDGKILEIAMKDKVYPFVLKQYFKAYANTDVISTWVEIKNEGKKPVVMYRFASAYIPIKRADNYLTHMHGGWAAEHMQEEDKLASGIRIISNVDNVRNTQLNNPSVMISLDGKAQEESGRVFGGTLAWAGNFQIKMDVNKNRIDLFAGISEENSHYKLEAKEEFATPEFAMTYSNNGKGDISRAFHRWARKYKLMHATEERDILLNSWEGVYMDVEQSKMDQMMEDISAMGGELFVMDDGWFGNKYPRDTDRQGLGDWSVNKKKLPNGIEGLLQSAKKHNIKFGIWIEPEMANTKSELYEKHPDWVITSNNRPLTVGRGQSQVILDLSNPEVQDHVVKVFDDIMTNYPEIAYIKWDANNGNQNFGSYYLPKDKQSHIYIEYHRGLEKALKRIRAKHPNVIVQDCASGGGRVNYGILPYFDEFWTSDNTDALERVYMQWSVSHFYPAIAMASHVSAHKNHQTGRITPLKYRFDVAMSGRLGMELQPADMSADEKEFAAKAIAAYKTIRPVVQHGDLYRLVSPYDKKGFASLMYVTPEKNRAVFFAYKTEHLKHIAISNVRLSGVDVNKKYKIVDLTPKEKPCAVDGKIISGKTLKEEGINLRWILGSEYSSVALELVEVK